MFGVLFTAEVMPTYVLLHARAKQAIDPVLDVTGLWQGSWELFAPTPDRINVRIVATIQWKDGTSSTVCQPSWSEMSWWDRKRNFRLMSYYDNLWPDGNETAWQAFCEYISKRIVRQENRQQIQQIVLTRYRDIIPHARESWRKAYSEPNYAVGEEIFTWTAN